MTIDEAIQHCLENSCQNDDCSREHEQLAKWLQELKILRKRKMNKCFLKGNVGQDPKITTFRDGGKVAQFTLATTERGFTTRDGKQIPDVTDWHNIVVKRTGLAGVCEQYVKRGTPLLVVGKIQTRSYEDNAGQTRYITEIVVEEMELLGGKKPEQAPAPEYTPGGGYQDDLPAD